MPCPRRPLLGWLPAALLVACAERARLGGRVTIGAISHGEGAEVMAELEPFRTWLATEAGALVQLDPAFNENRAFERIRSRAWDLVVAPPGLAALAMGGSRYQPLFPLVGVANRRSLFAVQRASPITSLTDLAGRRVALGQPGSVTGYYYPLFNLYGLTLAELAFAPTPRAALAWLVEGRFDAVALSQDEFDAHNGPPLRILAADQHYVPPGLLLLTPDIERTRGQQLQRLLADAPSVITRQVGYAPGADLPDYRHMFAVVERVQAIFPQAPTTAVLRPAQLFQIGGRTPAARDSSRAGGLIPARSETMG